MTNVYVCSGARPSDPVLARGLFVRPTVFGNVDNGMRIAREEVFGPVASLIRFSDEADAVRIANDSEYGLAAGVWTTDVARAMRLTTLLPAGIVRVNGRTGQRLFTSTPRRKPSGSTLETSSPIHSIPVPDKPSDLDHSGKDSINAIHDSQSTAN